MTEIEKAEREKTNIYLNNKLKEAEKQLDFVNKFANNHNIKTHQDIQDTFKYCKYLSELTEKGVITFIKEID